MGIHCQGILLVEIVLIMSEYPIHSGGSTVYETIFSYNLMK